MSSSTNSAKEFREEQRVQTKTIKPKKSSPKPRHTEKSQMTYAETVQQFQKDLQEIANQIENDFKKNRFITYSLEHPRSPLIDRIKDLRRKYEGNPYYLKSVGRIDPRESLKGMSGIGREFGIAVDRLYIDSRSISGEKLLERINSILDDINMDLPNEFMLDEIEREICNGVSNSKVGKIIKKRAREMAILIIFEIQLEEGKISEEYLNEWESGPIRDTIVLSRLINEIQNPVKNEDAINPIEEEICKGVSDSVIGNTIRKNARNMAVFVFNELEGDKAVEQRVKKQLNLEKNRKNGTYFFDSSEYIKLYIKPYLKEGMLYSDKLKLLKEKAILARNHYTFGGFYIDEKNMIEFLRVIVLVATDSNYANKRSRAIAYAIKLLFNEPFGYIDEIADRRLFSVFAPYHHDPNVRDYPNLVKGLEQFTELIDKINKALPEIIKFESMQKEVEQFRTDIDERYKDTDIWECIKKYLPRITEEVYKSREEKKYKDELEKKRQEAKLKTDSGDAR